MFLYFQFLTNQHFTQLLSIVDIEKFEINRCIDVSICMHMCIFMLLTSPRNCFFSPSPHREKREKNSSCFSLWVWVWLWRDALVSCREGRRARTDKKRTNLLLSASWPYLHPSHCVADVRQTTGTWLLPSMALALLGKGTLIWRSLVCYTCCGHALACDREANCPHWPHGMGSDPSCPSAGMACRASSVVLLFFPSCGFSMSSLQKTEWGQTSRNLWPRCN